MTASPSVISYLANYGLFLWYNALHVYECVCARVCVSVCVCACVYACVYMSECARARACVLHSLQASVIAPT